MVDSKQKGATAETVVRDALRKATNLKWERVPGSGMLDVKHQLKGDLYVPSCNNAYAVEVKHYKDTYLDYTVLTSKSSQLLDWWKQAKRQGVQLGKKPLLIFKHDRSKLFCAQEDEPKDLDAYRWLLVNHEEGLFYTSLLDDWLVHEQPKFILD